MKGKLIVIEGTDCSGKETQSNKLLKYFEDNNIKVIRFSFPMYDTPTGKIVGGPFLGKEEISKGFFPESAPNVDGKVSSLYFAADRYYNINKINEKLNDGYIVILDRYTYSNMAHQGCKASSYEEREKIFDFIDTLEFKLLGLPKADKVLLLYMPLKYSKILKKNREYLDENEKDDIYLQKSEDTYLELANKYNFDVINCVENDRILSFDEIFDKIINSLDISKS